MLQERAEAVQRLQSENRSLTFKCDAAEAREDVLQTQLADLVSRQSAELSSLKGKLLAALQLLLKCYSTELHQARVLCAL